MEVQLIQWSKVPFGVVTSFILNESSRFSEDRSVRSNEVFISVCPTGRLLAFVAPFKAQFIACDEPLCLSQGVLPKYLTSYEGLIHIVRDPMSPKPTATACLVIPVSFGPRTGGSSQTSSVIVIGFSDGFIRGYSKTGKTVFSQLLHPEPVVSMKVLCQPSTHGHQPLRSPDSLIVLLKGKVVCVVLGQSLTELMSFNIARLNTDDYSPNSEQQMSLNYKKFYLQDQTNVSDISLLGESTMPAFDYLREASIVGGWDANIRSGPVPEAKLITVGEQPMIGLYRLSKDAGTLNMSEVVHAVASRMTSAVLGRLSAAGGWLNWGGGGAGGGAKTSSQTPTKGKPPEEKQQPKMNLQMSTNIPDPRRHVTSIVVSPNGNLASLVDGFGRVVLLDIGSLVIRRMWKGYRDAQCGWIMVSDPADSSRHAQCLCVYAPRRGILEFWPVQTGPRVAAFQVGKGCRLLHITDCLFGEGEAPPTDHSVKSGIEDRAVLITNDGRLLTFTVPFPLLVKRSSPRSHDSHMLLTLNKALATGDEKVICEVTRSVKSSQALQEILQFVINSFEDSQGSSISKETILRVLNISVLKTKSQKDFTVPEELNKHCVMVRQVVRFYFDILELSEIEETKMDDTNTLSQFLQDQFGVAFHFAERLELLLCSYFKLIQPVKRVRQVLRLTDLMNCFEIHTVTVDCLLPPMKSSEESNTTSIGEVVLRLKENMENKVELDLAEFIFKRVLSLSISYHQIDTVLKESLIDPSQLLTLLFKYWVSGNFNPSNLMLSVTSLLEISRLLLNEIDSNNSNDYWNEIQSVLAASPCPGHALLGTMFCNYLSSNRMSPIATNVSAEKVKQDGGHTEDTAVGDDNDEWEALSVEREQWARLIELLELLTELSLVMRSAILKPVTPIVAVDKTYMEDGVLCTRKMKIKMLFGEDDNGDSEGSVSVSALVDSGPALFGHSIAQSIVSRGLPASMITEMKEGASQNILHSIRTLSNGLPMSLSVTNILMYCAFQAALKWSQCDTKDNEKLLLVTLDYITHIPLLNIAEGFCGFLWYSLLEKEIRNIIESLKKRGTSHNTDSVSSLLWVCRNVICFLLKCGLLKEEMGKDYYVNTDNPSCNHDVIDIPSPPDMVFLPAIAGCFPSCTPDALSLCLQLILLMEMLMSSDVPSSNVLSFFPSSFHSMWSKGMFSSDGRMDAIQKNMQLKRFKFLCGAVTSVINGCPCIKQNANFNAVLLVKTPLTLQYDFSHYQDLVFGLASLWELKTDEVKTHWVASLFAAGKDETGKQIYHGIIDKADASGKLLSLAGHMTLKVINSKDRQVQAMLFSQSPPGIMEWMKKQASHPTVATLSGTSAVSTSRTVLCNLLNTIGPDLASNPITDKTFHNLNNFISLL